MTLSLVFIELTETRIDQGVLFFVLYWGYPRNGGTLLDLVKRDASI